MNKLISIIVLSLVTANLQAQQLRSQIPANAKQMTAQEANALNGKTEPTINGIPYSQYKAQQDAIKARQATNEQVAPALPVKPVSAEELKNTRKEEKPATLKQPASKEAN